MEVEEKIEFVCLVCECGKDAPVRREIRHDDCPVHLDGMHVYKQMNILNRLEWEKA